MKKVELLEKMWTARRQWEAVLEQVPEARFTEPSMHGGWTVKDSMGHVAYYEHWLLNWLEDAVRGKVTVATHRDLLSVDARNSLIYVENKDRDLQAIESDAKIISDRLYQLVKALPEIELIEPYRFDRYIVPFWEKSLPLWECIEGDSYGHYSEHTENIRIWLQESALEPQPLS